MSYISRVLSSKIAAILERGKSVLLLGPRQTGKTTMLQRLKADLYISFIQPRIRLRYELDPSLLADEVRAVADNTSNKPLIIIDEVQKVPLIMDVVQELIDSNIAIFILTGSSARKLRHGRHVNLLPGRIIPLHMYPLAINEIPKPNLQLHELLVYGSLPEITMTKNLEEKEQLLDAYVAIYLEQEIRAEALVRNVANFARFLELAANESGQPVNYSKLSKIVGVAHTTIADYYQILEDCFVAIRIEPLLKTKTRHKLSKSQKYIMFDLGLRRVAAREGIKPSIKQMGHLFEQFVALELIKQAQYTSYRTSIKYWSDLQGPEVDWVIEKPNCLIPLEVKYTDKPSMRDAKHLQTFLNEYEEADQAYIICQAPRKMKLADNIHAIPWQELQDLV